MRKRSKIVQVLGVLLALAMVLTVLAPLLMLGSAS
jgi:hypothetical protein